MRREDAHVKKRLEEMTLEELWTLFPVRLTAHRAEWAAAYREMEAALRAALAGRGARRISHIGRTAVEGIWAKPIVDILVELEPGAPMEPAAEAVENMGFLCMSAAEGRMAFNLGYTEEGFGERVFHLHLRPAGDNGELYFRDYLNAHPPEAAAYERLKLTLWRMYPRDRDGYTGAKTAFVRRRTERAKALWPDRYR